VPKKMSLKGWFSGKISAQKDDLDASKTKDEATHETKDIRKENTPDKSKTQKKTEGEKYLSRLEATSDAFIDKNARSREEIKRCKEAEIELLKTMGKEFRELAKLDEAGAEAKEERKKEMEKVKSARTFFKTVDDQLQHSDSASRLMNVPKLASALETSTW